MAESHADLQAGDDPKDSASSHHGYLEEACGCRHTELVDGVLHRPDGGHSGDEKDDSSNDDQRRVDAQQDVNAMGAESVHARRHQGDERSTRELGEEWRQPTRAGPCQQSVHGKSQ
jgi:hypothetical protein